jgi:hypothetical protein
VLALEFERHLAGSVLASESRHSANQQHGGNGG